MAWRADTSVNNCGTKTSLQAGIFFSSGISRRRREEEGGGGGGGQASNIKGRGLSSHLRVQNQEFWSRLGGTGRKATTFSSQSMCALKKITI